MGHRSIPAQRVGHSIYQLLGPQEERDTIFWTGVKDYDPINLGFVADSIEGGFKFMVSDTVRFDKELQQRRIPGNSNEGHLFTGDSLSWKDGGGVVGRALSHTERMAIIEFLKAMPVVPGGGN